MAEKKNARMHNLLSRISFTITILTLTIISDVWTQENGIGTIKGKVIDQSTNRPVEFVNVVLRARTDSTIITGIVTDKTGGFDFADIPTSEYFITFSLIGYKEKSTHIFSIDVQHKHLNVGEVNLVPTTVNLDEVLITAEKSMYNNAFDRKVYNVDQDMMSKAASVSELLQNVPSVTVDIDGNVSLRGSTNVLIMVDGRTSALMDKNSATVLEQMPASSIEKIEVMTNPSAKYKPDAASGIINIVTKKNTTLGINGDVGGNVGNQDRFNANLRLNYNPGAFNLFGSYAIRKDTRNRISSDNRRQVDSISTTTFYDQDITSYARPLSHIASIGLEYHADARNDFALSGNYLQNTFTRTDNNHQVLFTADNLVLNEYVRERFDNEYEKEYGFTSYFEHSFQNRDHKLHLEFSLSRAPEQEDNHYTNIYSVPVSANSFDNILITNDDKRSQVTLEYSDPLSEKSTLQAGYSGEFNNSDFAFDVANFDATRNRFVADIGRTNRFLYDEYINAVYITYKRSFGVIGFEGGVRMEEASTKGSLVTLDSTINNSFFNLYPSLHLSYKLTKSADLQLSYSRRIHRPETEDLNPFPEYRDPRNYTSGNPKTLPEYIHQIEFGCQFQNDQVTILPALYYRNTLNRFTMLTRVVNDTLLVTSRGNLSSDQSGGLEIVLSADMGGIFTAHWSGNAFLEQIDATNLGYSGKRSTTSWSSVFTLGVNLSATSRMQVNANYISRRLTPQGEFTPSYLFNSGIRQDLMDKKLSLVFTAADIFKTLKRELALNTLALDRDFLNRRDAQIIYFGVTYHFGVPPKNAKEDQLRYDDNL